MARIACFGEVLIRLSPDGGAGLRDNATLDLFVGGAEANVGVGLSRLGHQVRMITALPDNDLGALALETLGNEGIDTSCIVHGTGRMGLYFVEGYGTENRGKTTYDREESVFARSSADNFDFKLALEEIDLVLLGGITPALGRGPAQAALALAQEARAKGVPLAFDCNYRPDLWNGSDRDPASVLRPIVELANILFGNHRDARYLTGHYGSDQQAAAKSLLERFAHLDVVIGTRRAPFDEGAITVLATADRRTGLSDADPVIIRDHIGRIGSGDAFAAAVLHGLIEGLDDSKALELGLSAMRMKHATAGDMPRFTRRDLGLSEA